jgi:hypothetical protein
LQTKSFALGRWKSLASAQRQATHTEIIGGYNFYGRCNYKYSTHQWNWDLMCRYLKNLLNSIPRRLQNVTRKEGKYFKY